MSRATFFFFKQKTAYEIGLGIPAEPLFRSHFHPEAVQNQNEPQLRDENAHNDKSVHGVLNPTYQARSEERRVGKECRSGRWPYHEKKKKDEHDMKAYRDSKNAACGNCT